MDGPWIRALPVLLLALTLEGCDFVGDIFEAGFWMGVIVVVGILALVLWGLFKLFD